MERQIDTGRETSVRSPRTAERLSELILDTVRTPMAVLDDKLRIVLENEAFRRLLDREYRVERSSREDLDRLPWSSDRLDGLLRDLVLGGPPIEDFAVVNAARTYLVNARRGEVEDHAPIVVLSFEDTTPQEGARHKDEWIGLLGHELRNPVGAVSNGVELLLAKALSEEQESQILLMCRRQLDNVNGLLDSLLDAARILAGKLAVGDDVVDLADVVEEALAGVESELDEHRLEASTPFPGELHVRGDRFRLVQIVGNLLANAARYTSVGGEIRLDVHAEGSEAVIVVEDTGVGIEPDVAENIFEMFYQGPSDPTVTAGLGMGLPLVRTLTDLHGGSVRVHSEGKGRGSRFTVTLPRIDTSDEVPGGGASTESEGLAAGRRILIVEDHDDARNALDTLMELKGHEVMAFADGAAALEAARQCTPDVALVDLGLPGMDGYEVARALRDEFPDALLIAMSGFRGDRIRLLRAGFDHYFSKPVDHDRLAGLINESVEGRKDHPIARGGSVRPPSAAPPEA